MNDLVNKIKTYDYKGFGLKHGEKVGLSLVILFTLLAIYKTTWGSSIDKSPQDLVDQAGKAMTALTTSNWPDDEKEKFKVEDIEERAKQRQLALTPDRFRFDAKLTPPVYPKTQPAERPVMYAVLSPEVSAGDFPTPTNPPASTNSATGEQPGVPGGKPATAPTAEEVDPEFDTPVDAAPVVKTPAGGAPGVMPNEDDEVVARRLRQMRRMREGMDDEPMPARAKSREAGKKGGAAAAVAMKEPEPVIHGRGLRYVSYRAVFPYEDQVREMAKALHHSNMNRAADDVEFYDFQIQRQRLIKKDPQTWGEWETLEYATARSILEELPDYAPDVVRTEVINNVITMPLPPRIRGRWAISTAGHTLLEKYLLDAEADRVKELAINQAVAKQAEELKLDAPKKRIRPGSGLPRGNSRMVNDLNAQRRRVGMYMLNNNMNDNAEMEDGMRNMVRQRQQMMGGMGGGMDIAGGQQIVNSGVNQNQIGNRKNLGLAGIIGSDPFAIPKYMLFRYLDFTVEPGECYRYRVRLQFLN
ncbi:MAG: hypothetical protein K8R36_22170, partial [Planctomycetales bacterium]|nr:hypothetical protein [Planctomycetales bacterium]